METGRPNSPEVKAGHVRLNTLFQDFQKREMWNPGDVQGVLEAAAETLDIDDLSGRLDMADCRNQQIAFWTIEQKLADAVV